MFVAPNVMLMNVMACRVFRNTKFSNQWVDPTISIPSIPLQAPDANSSAIPAVGENQSRGSWEAIEGGKLENPKKMMM
jgi:hypothetical protein